MKRILRITALGLLLLINLSMNAQVRKLISGINSIGTKELITFRYNNKNQLVYFDEKGVATFRHFTLKYDKTTGQLIEHNMNEEDGELTMNIKYDYQSNAGHIREKIKMGGKKNQDKLTHYNDIQMDDKGRLAKTIFDDGQPWEDFEYDDNNNILKYTLHSAGGKDNTSSTYKFNTEYGIFCNMLNPPLWLFALNLNNMKWAEGLIGSNLPIEVTADDPRYGTETTEITYEYDSDGYPLRQYYDGKLVREFSYTPIK